MEGVTAKVTAYVGVCRCGAVVSACTADDADAEEFVAGPGLKVEVRTSLNVTLTPCTCPPEVSREQRLEEALRNLLGECVRVGTDEVAIAAAVAQAREALR